MNYELNTNVQKFLSYLEKLIFYAFIFSIPFQTRKFFYLFTTPFNEWTTIFLYWTDILIFLLFILWSVKKCRTHYALHINWTHAFLLAFIGWSGFSIFFANNIYLSAYNWIKLLEMAFLFFYVRDFLRRKGGNGLTSMLWVFILSAFFQAFIALFQFFTQRSLGFNIFHESPLGILIDGVAKLDFFNFQMIRAYGTFPHPNVLAAFLGLAIFSCYWLWLKDARFSQIKNYILWFIIAVLFMGLFLTFSRSAITLTIILSIFFFGFLYFSTKDIYRRTKICELSLIVILCVVALVLILQPLLIERFDVDLGEQAINLRAFYTKVSLDFIKQSPIFGVGIGSFVDSFRNSEFRIQNSELWMYQPVHNLYLLIASDTGILGLVLFLAFISLIFYSVIENYYSNQNNVGINKFYVMCFMLYVLCSMFYVLGLGLFDHYFWTLQQGRLMMWLVFAIVSTNYYLRTH